MSRQSENHRANEEARRRLARDRQELERVAATLRHLAKDLDYRQLVRHIRRTVNDMLPDKAKLLVISKGDPALLRFSRRRAAHFPQSRSGQYAGHYPATGAEALAHLLEVQEREGAQYLVVPATAFWWMEHYREMGRYLEGGCEQVLADAHCRIFRLAEGEAGEEGLKELQRNWHEFGRRDPLWAILTYPEKRNHRWSERDFFQTGEVEINNLMQRAASLKLPRERRRALDFGCGVGRLTQALCRHFERCDGVDIAPSMIELAEEYNRHGERCVYHLNEANDLRLFDDESFDLIYSNIVLQHMRPEYVRNYVREFVRLLAPGGLLVFQLPTCRLAMNPQAAPHKKGATTDALPDAAFKALISVKGGSWKAQAASLLSLRVRVKNASGVAWPEEVVRSVERGVWLGNHWLEENGTLLVNDDGKTMLPRGLKPDEEVELELIANTPDVPGRYRLELDLVQEGVAWFKQKGSAAKVLDVHVTGRRGAKERGVEGGLKGENERIVVPLMEMHGAEKDVVLEWLLSAEGVVVEVRENDFAPGWSSYEYYVTK